MERLSIVSKRDGVVFGGSVTGDCSSGSGLNSPSVDDGAVGALRWRL